MKQQKKTTQNATNNVAISAENIRNAIDNILKRHLEKRFPNKVLPDNIEPIKDNETNIEQESNKEIKISRIGSPPGFHPTSIFGHKPHPLDNGGII